MTTRLYPRLIKSKATALFETLDSEAQWADAHRSVTYAPTGPDRVTPAELRELREKIVVVAERHGFPFTSTQTGQIAFDRDAAGVLIRESRLFPAEAAVGDVWSFVALVLLPDVARWRSESRNIEVFRGTDLTRHVFARLWWRAYLLGGEQRPDVELHRDLGVFGSADFDQIQTRRTAFGGSPHFVRTFVGLWGELQADGRMQALGEGEKRVAERDLLRNVLMRVRRSGAFIQYEVLDPEQLRAHLLDVLGAAVEALGGDASPFRPETSSNGAVDFDHTSIDTLLERAVGVIRAEGTVADDALISTFEARMGIPVPPKRQRMLRRLLLRSAQDGAGVVLQDGTWTVSGPGDPPSVTALSMAELSARAVELDPWADGTSATLLEEAFATVSGVARWLAEVAVEEASQADTLG